MIYCTIKIVQAFSCNVNNKRAFSRVHLCNIVDIRENSGGESGMLTAERRQYILNVLRRDGKVVAKQLSEELQLSEDTIRRDLRDLDGEGLLQRVHGGALPCAPATPTFKVRQEQLSQARLAIAQKAAQLVHDGQVVILDGGTTNVQVARHLSPDLHATIITNSPPLAAALEEHPHVEVVMLGGHLYKHSLVTVGAPAL